MNIVYVSEMLFEGKVPDDFPDMSVLFTQMKALGATHIPLSKILQDITLLAEFDIMIFIYPKNRPEVLTYIPTFKEYVRVVLNQEGSRDFWYDWDPRYQKLFLKSLELCDLFFANNHSDYIFFNTIIPGKVVLSPVSFNPAFVNKHSEGVVREDKILVAGNMCSWYGGLSSLLVAKKLNLPITIPSMGRKQFDEEILSEGLDVTYLPYLRQDEWVRVVAAHKYVIHLMPVVGGGNVALLASALGIPCIGNELWDTQSYCQAKTSVPVWNLEKAHEKLMLLETTPDLYTDYSKEIKELAYIFFTDDYVASIQRKHLEKIL